MKLTCLGHACYLLESDGYRIVMDPYKDVPGYRDPAVQAHEIFCSHDHFDHASRDVIELLPERESPFTVRKVTSYHDNENGTKRGVNTIHVLEAEGLCVVHLGDLGQSMLTGEQVKEIGTCDVLLVPVGGYYTMDGDTAAKVADALGCKTVVPMHYTADGKGFDEVVGPEKFLSHYAPEQIRYLDSASFEPVKSDVLQIIVPLNQD